MKKIYLWHSVDPFGKEHKGLLEAPHRADVHHYLAQKNLLARCIRLQHVFSEKSINLIQKTQLMRQMTTLLRSGLPLIPMLDLLQSTQRRRLKIMLQLIQNDLENGHTFANALRRHPALFNAMQCHLLALGETLGTLPNIFDTLIRHQEKRIALQRKLKKTLTYPVIVFFFSLGLTALLLLNVVPHFAVLFTQLGTPLPLATQRLLHAAAYLKAYGLESLTLGLLIMAFFYGLSQRVLAVKHCLKKALFNLPGLRSFWQDLTLARFTNAFSLTYQTGLSVMEALVFIEDIIDHPRYKIAIRLIQNHIRQGQSLSEALLNTHVFPAFMCQLIKMAETSRNLDTVLDQLSRIYTERMDSRLDTLSRLFEPVFMACLGLWIFVLVMGLYLPLFESGGLIT